MHYNLSQRIVFAKSHGFLMQTHEFLMRAPQFNSLAAVFRCLP
jgi:hypothetical protein